MPSVRSAALGFFVAHGSRGETERGRALALPGAPALQGLPSLRLGEIDQLFDGMGAELNAGTDKETTTVYARMLDQHLPRAFDVMADMVWRPAFRDVDSEREVVLEEIAMYEDDPQDTVFDVLGEAVFGDHPLGRPIIGRAPVIRDTPVTRSRPSTRAATCRARSSSRPPARSTTTRSSSCAARRWARAAGDAPEPEPGPERPRRPCASSARTPSSATSASARIGLPRGDERRFALRVLDAIFGGLSSSRLFQAVREERGLAYSVYSFTGQYADTGQIGLYVGTRPDNLGEAMRVVGDELARLRERARHRGGARARARERQGAASCSARSRPARA